MKKIGIDARLLYQTGVGTYLQNLLFYLDKKKIKDNLFFVYLLKKDFNKINFKNKNIIKKIADFKWHSFSEQVGFLKILLKDNLDLVHFTYFTFPIFYPKKFILTVHDLTMIFFKTGKASTKNIFFYYLKYFIFKLFFFISLIRAKIIITPTFSVKKQLIDYVNFNIEKKIRVIYEGISYHLLNCKIKKRLEFKNFKKFFLYIGNFYPHKNVENLIDAYIKIKAKNQLILIGPDGYFYERIKKYLDKIKDPRIILLKNIKREEINWFYKNCLALIHPSLSEGFGLTLVEAAFFNKPIIASNIDVFKELWKNEYIAFDPKNIDDIKSKIEYFIKRKPKFNYKKILKKLSFQKMADKTLKLYLNF